MALHTIKMGEVSGVKFMVISVPIRGSGNLYPKGGHSTNNFVKIQANNQVPL